MTAGQWLSCVLVGIGLSAQALSINSTAGRFKITGEDPIGNYQCARWAEEMAGKAERLLEVSLPTANQEFPVEIILDSTSTFPPATSVRRSRQNGRLVRQAEFRILQLAEPAVVGGALVDLLLAGLIEDRRRMGQAEPIDISVPGWLSVGLVGVLDRAMLSEGRASVFLPEADVFKVSVEEILGWAKVPEQMPTRHALCMMFADWIVSAPGAKTRLVEQLTGQKPITPDALAGMMGFSSVLQMGSGWQDWLQKQGRLVRQFGEVSLEGIEQFRAECPMRIPVSQGDGEQVVVLTPAELIERRHEFPGMVLLAKQKMVRLQLLTVGQAPEWVAVAREYAAFFEGVARGAWSWTLKRRLKRAEESLERLVRLTRARKAYLDEFEDTMDLRNIP